MIPLGGPINRREGRAEIRTLGAGWEIASVAQTFRPVLLARV